jgi:hypothetical protein
LELKVRGGLLLGSTDYQRAIDERSELIAIEIEDIDERSEEIDFLDKG